MFHLAYTICINTAVRYFFEIVNHGFNERCALEMVKNETTVHEYNVIGKL